MKNFMVIVLLFLLLYMSQLFAQSDIVALFEERSHTFNETTLPYRLFVPENYDTTKSYPLVLALHGSGERGTDNRHIRSSRLATSWADPVNQAKYPCIVFAPQCPQGRQWAYGFGAEQGPESATTMDILDSLIREFSVDENRIYVTGLSMGGYGTWDLLQRFPDRFAAGIPMSAGGNPESAETFAETPIWNFHGKVDDVVSVSLSRNTISAMEETGSTVVYTHCKYENCIGLPENQINMYIQSQADHLYTEYENGDHVIWDQSYDYPFLFPWVFSKFKRTTEAINISGFNTHRILDGEETIGWNAIPDGGTVDIWFSPDAGESWQNVAEGLVNNGSFQWNTESVDDISFGILKILLHNEKGFIFALDETGYFSIDNESGNGVPFVRILNKEFERGVEFEDDELDLELLAGDSESSELVINYFYAVGNQSGFIQFLSGMISPDTISQFKTIDLSSLPNSTSLRLKVEVTDGNTFSADTTFYFTKNTERQFGNTAKRISGTSSAIIRPVIINSDDLTSDSYQLTFHVDSTNNKSYSVVNKNSGRTVIENATEIDGVSEGPYFDGLRLVIEDYKTPDVDHENSSWQVGSTGLTTSIFVPTVNIDGRIHTGTPVGDDFRISVFDHVVDTTSAAFGIPEIEINFMVEKISQGNKVEILFVDKNGDKNISRNDILYLLRDDNLDDPHFTWAITFVGEETDATPQPGDIYNFYTKKPVADSDVYEFDASLSSLDFADKEKQPNLFSLFQNYPNPFNPVTAIGYRLSVFSQVDLSIYNQLGERVKTLVSENQPAGEYEINWDASQYASGVYYYQLKAGDFKHVRKMILIK